MLLYWINRSVQWLELFQLWLFWKVNCFLSFNYFEKGIRAFISLRIIVLSYCNALCVGTSQASLYRHQLVQNAAAHLLTNTRKHE